MADDTLLTSGDVTEQTTESSTEQTQTESTTTEFKSFLNEDGSFAENFKLGLPEEIRDSAEFDKYKDFASMAKSLVNQSKLVGRKMEKLPTAESSREEWNEFYEKMGRPKEIAGYDLKHIEGINADEYKESTSAFAQKAHDLGLSKDVAQQLMSWYEQNEVENSATQQTQSLEDTVAELRKDWGADYDNNLKNASLVAENLGITKEIEEAGLGVNPTVLKLLSTIASRTKEGGFMMNQASQFTGSIDDRLKEIGMEIKEAYSSSSPKLPELLKMQRKLIEEKNTN